MRLAAVFSRIRSTAASFPILAGIIVDASMSRSKTVPKINESTNSSWVKLVLATPMANTASLGPIRYAGHSGVVVMRLTLPSPWQSPTSLVMRPATPDTQPNPLGMPWVCFWVCDFHNEISHFHTYIPKYPNNNKRDTCESEGVIGEGWSQGEGGGVSTYISLSLLGMRVFGYEAAYPIVPDVQIAYPSSYPRPGMVPVWGLGHWTAPTQLAHRRGIPDGHLARRVTAAPWRSIAGAPDPDGPARLTSGSELDA